VRGRTAGVSASGGLSYYAAPFRLAAGVFSAPGADTRLRAGNVPGERAPADEAAIRARQHQAMLRAADATDEEVKAFVESIAKKRAKEAQKAA
jgi:hypothetical protein